MPSEVSDYGFSSQIHVSPDLKLYASLTIQLKER